MSVSPQSPRADVDNLRDRIRARLQEKPGNRGPTFLKDMRVDPRIIRDFKSSESIPTIPDVASLDRTSLAAVLTKIDTARRMVGAASRRCGWDKISVSDVEQYEEVFPSKNANTGEIYAGPVTAQVYTPISHNKTPDRPRPCIVYCHGDGMAAGDTTDLPYRTIGYLLAQQGVTVVIPAFTHATVAPHPRALHDCLSTCLWAARERKKLGCSAQLILAGENTGASLALATGLLSKRHCPDLIRGIHALSPALLFGRSSPEEFPSYKEFEGYAVCLDYYTGWNILHSASEDDAANSLSYPGLADGHELQTMPPVVLNVNELSPFRDEALTFYRRCLENGVSARANIRCGTTHGADVMYYGIIPELVQLTMAEVASFARSV